MGSIWGIYIYIYIYTHQYRTAIFANQARGGQVRGQRGGIYIPHKGRVMGSSAVDIQSSSCWTIVWRSLEFGQRTTHPWILQSVCRLVVVGVVVVVVAAAGTAVLACTVFVLTMSADFANQNAKPRTV